MKRLRTIEKDFVLKPNPYMTNERADSTLLKLAIGEIFGLSAFFCFTLTFLKVKPNITLANSFRNFTYLQGLTSFGAIFYHLYELNLLGKEIPAEELSEKIKTYDERYGK